MDIQDLYEIMKKNYDENRQDHIAIMNKLDNNAKSYVRWRVFVLIIPIVLGAYGFAWAYGNWVAQMVINHIIGG